MPLIVRVPPAASDAAAASASAQRARGIVELIDVMPTLGELAGLDACAAL